MAAAEWLCSCSAGCSGGGDGTVAPVIDVIDSGGDADAVEVDSSVVVAAAADARVVRCIEGIDSSLTHSLRYATSHTYDCSTAIRIRLSSVTRSRFLQSQISTTLVLRLIMSGGGTERNGN